MIHTIREAFNELLAENVWMDDETRAVAKEKADAMNERIGYPELLTNPEELSKEYINVRHLRKKSCELWMEKNHIGEAFRYLKLVLLRLVNPVLIHISHFLRLAT